MGTIAECRENNYKHGTENSANLKKTNKNSGFPEMPERSADWMNTRMVSSRERPVNILRRRIASMPSAVREESFSSVKVFWLDKEYVFRQLRERVARLASDPNVLRVVLFGSFAEGRAVPGSDVDILIVVRQDSRRMMDRIADYQEIFSGMGIGTDVFPYTESELENPLAKNALATGKILFER